MFIQKMLFILMNSSGGNELGLTHCLCLSPDVGTEQDFPGPPPWRLNGAKVT